MRRILQFFSRLIGIKPKKKPKDATIYPMF